MKRSVMVHVDVDVMVDDIKSMNLTRTKICEELGVCRCTFANSKQKGTMACKLIKQIIDKYFIYDPEIYQKWISVHDLYIYESWLKGKPVVDTNNVVSVDHDRMNAKLEEMNLKFPSVCRIFGFSDNYGAEIKYRGVCNRKFLEKFCELTNTQPADYITAGKEAELEEVAPELLENIGECASEILRSVQAGVDSVSRVEAGIDNVDAGIVGVLKELQKMTKQLMLISKALGVEEEKND